MSRAKWLFLGLAWLSAGVVAAGCATGSTVGDESADDSGTEPATEDARPDTHALGDATGAHDVGRDTTTPSTGDDDSSTGGDPDTGNGEDTGSDEDGGVDATVADTSVPDTSVPDAHDAGHDAHDANVPDTNVPDTNVPDTNIPDTNVPDTNIPDINVPDTNPPPTDAGCSPTGTSYTKVIHAPATQAGACTSAQASSFYTACLTGSAAACASWENLNGACASCLEGATDPAGTTWGPYQQWPLSSTNSVLELDIGGCLIKTNESASCGHDFEYLTECEHYFCGTSCFGNSFTHYQDCAAAADKSQCLAEYNAVYVTATPCTNSLFASSTCLNWSTFQAGFLAIAAVMCE